MGRSAEKKALIILGAAVFLLLISILWSVNSVGGYVASLNIPRAFLCREIQKDVAPVPLTEKLYPDQKQVCIWFEYERAKIGDRVKVLCYKEKTQVAAETISLTSKDGVRAFYLIRKNGSGLPTGSYSVIISTETKELYRFTFDVIEKPKEVAQKISKPVVKKTKAKTKIKAGGAKNAKNKKSSRRHSSRTKTGRRRRR